MYCPYGYTHPVTGTGFGYMMTPALIPERLMKEMLENLQSCIRIQGKKPKPFDVTKGFRQKDGQLLGAKGEASIKPVVSLFL